MEAEAFERVVMEQKDRIFSYASLMLRDRAEAQDVAQDALIRLWNHRREVEDEGAHRWLRRTTHNLCIDRLRRRKSRPETSVSETVDCGADGGPGPQRLAESGELAAALTSALEALHERDRAVILLREVEGLGYNEIAEILRVPLGTLKARLHRAREHLRARLVRAGVAP